MFRPGDGWHDKVMDFTRDDRIVLTGGIDDWRFNGVNPAGDGTRGLTILYEVNGQASGSIILRELEVSDISWVDQYIIM